MGTWHFEAVGTPGALSLNGNNYLATLAGTEPDHTILAAQLAMLGQQMTTSGAGRFAVMAEGQANGVTMTTKTQVFEAPPVGGP